MQQEDRNKQLSDKIKKLVEQFPEGHARYKADALFNNIVQSLARGADPYEIIDKLIITTNDVIKKNIELAKAKPLRFIIDKGMMNQFDNPHTATDTVKE
jgi:methanogenic corrinoid protein MtbC1